MRRRCLLKHITEKKTERRKEVTGRGGRIGAQLLDDIKERHGYWKLKEAVPDRAAWKTRSERSYGLFVRQTAE